MKALMKYEERHGKFIIIVLAVTAVLNILIWFQTYQVQQLIVAGILILAVLGSYFYPCQSFIELYRQARKGNISALLGLLLQFLSFALVGVLLASWLVSWLSKI